MRSDEAASRKVSVAISAVHRSFTSREAGAILLLIATVTLFYLLMLRTVIFIPDEVRVAGKADLVWLHGPMQFFLDTRLDAGDFPLWNPLTLSGKPMAANPLARTFYPPNLARSVLVVGNSPRDTFLSLSLLSLFHALLFALGMYGLGLQESLSRPTSLMVAISTTFSGHVLNSFINHLSFLYAFAWTPIVLVCLCKAVKSVEVRRRAGWLVVGGLLYGQQILAGFPPISAYATLVYVFFLALRTGIPEDSSTVSARETLRRYAGWVGGVALFGLTGALLASALILPAAELFELSARAPENFERHDNPGSSLVNITLWTSLIPITNSFSETPPSFLDGAREIAKWLSELFSLNVSILFAGTVAVFARPKRRVVVYGLLLYLLSDLCLGPPMPVAWLLERTPFGVNSSQYGSILLILPLGMLAGFGVETIYSQFAARGLPRRVVLYLVCTGLFMVVFMPEPNSGWFMWSYQWALIPLGILILMSFGSRLPHGRYIVPLLMLAETALCGSKIVEMAFDKLPGGMVAPKTWAKIPPAEPRQSRSISFLGNHHVWLNQKAINGYDPLVLEATARVLADPGEEDHYSRYPQMRRNLSAASFLKRSFWLVPAYVRGGLPEKERAFPPAHVVFLSDVPEISLQELALKDVPRTFIAEPRVVAVFFSEEQKDHIAISDVVLPKQNSALLVEYASPDAAILRLRVRGANINEFFNLESPAVTTSNHETATLEFPLPDFAKMDIKVSVFDTKNGMVPAINRISIISDMSDESGLIRIVRDTPDRVMLEVRDVPGRRALVFTDAAYPGWQAFVDGTRVPIHLANNAFKAVIVPEGTHEIRFEFRPWRVYVGTAVSMLTLIASLVFLLWCFRRDRQVEP